MNWGLIFLLAILPFGIVLIKGPPWLRTLKKDRQKVFDLLKLKKGDELVDFGCGDGQLLIEAAKRGVNSVGYELNPIMFAVAWLRTLPYRSTTKVYCKDFWGVKINSSTDVIFVFLQERFMQQLQEKMENEAPKGLKLVSFTFVLPDKKPALEDGLVHVYRY